VIDKKFVLLVLLLYLHLNVCAQQISNTAHANKKNAQTIKEYNVLYQFGIANAFLSGLYKGTLPLWDLKKHGDFGLGAPDMLDGEWIMNNGKMYQTRFTGKTSIVPDSVKTSLSFVCFFSADTTVYASNIQNKENALKWIDSFLNNKNGIYAIRISGTFEYVKTRSFPPVKKEPFISLASMMSKQCFFELKNIKGVFAGFKIPSFLAGPSIPDFHFHFISGNEDAGGHVVNFVWNNVKIEIDELNRFSIELPQNDEFRNFNFKTTRIEDIKKVESGIKE
jgi:acetolactate decarboxylase